jgi:chitin synthase
MLPLSGMVMDDYFMPPLNRACRGLGIKETTQLTFNDTITNPLAQHTSGFYARDRTSALHDPDWYWKKFQPKIKEYYHGNLVWKKSKVKNEGENEQHMWATYGNEVYDLTDYLHTLDVNDNFDSYKFLNEDMVDLWKNSPGTNIKKDLDLLIANAKNETVSANLKNSWQCIQNIAYKGILDFRDSPRCQVNNYLLLAFAVIICIVTAVKFLAALQFGSKRRPSPQDKFVICQVPVYTEGEDSLRKALDSLTALQYDNKRKLICVICDGVVVGQGNDRPTPKIVLDILGVDPKVDPPALPFKSVGSSSEQLNYGKVYSGLYEFEGNVVPYIVVVKVGKESEQSKAKPGNRGKRDSQILLMSFLNRVHHRAPMSPLELEMFHQVNNIIGVDPELYEYLLMVDADTCVEEDSLNRLVAACAHNAKIAGICGETTLENDEKTWWTMIQVYEYFISHHLAKAFESLFGSVTCLPGWYVD